MFKFELPTEKIRIYGQWSYSSLEVPGSVAHRVYNAGDTAYFDFDVKNTGYYPLDWEIVSVTCTNRNEYPLHGDDNFILSYSPSSGTGVIWADQDTIDTVKLSYTIPKWAGKTATFEWDIKIGIVNYDGGTRIVHVTCGIKETVKNKAPFLDNTLLQTRFPRLMNLLQRLSAFN